MCYDTQWHVRERKRGHQDDNGNQDNDPVFIVQIFTEGEAVTLCTLGGACLGETNATRDLITMVQKVSERSCKVRFVIEPSNVAFTTNEYLDFVKAIHDAENVVERLSSFSDSSQIVSM